MFGYHACVHLPFNYDVWSDGKLKSHGDSKWNVSSRNLIITIRKWGERWRVEGRQEGGEERKKKRRDKRFTTCLLKRRCSGIMYKPSSQLSENGIVTPILHTHHQWWRLREVWKLPRITLLIYGRAGIHNPAPCLSKHEGGGSNETVFMLRKVYGKIPQSKKRKSFHMIYWMSISIITSFNQYLLVS